MFSRASTVLLLLAAILLLSVISPHVYASDDSNPGNLTPITNSNGATPTTDQIIQMLNNLTQNGNTTPGSNGVNQTQLNQLTNQLESQLKSGNNVGAQQTLKQLQQLSQSPQGSDMSPLLRDLLESMSVNSNGLNLNTGLLQSLIGQPGANGMPTGLLGMDPATADRQLASLASALNNMDPQTASNLLQYSVQIQNSIGSGLLSGNGPGGLGGGSGNLGTPTIPNVSNIPNLLRQSGGVGGPSLPSVGTLTPGVPSLAGFGIPLLAIIIAAVAAIAGFFLLKNRFHGLGTRKIPGMIKRKPVKPDEGLNLNSPRDLIVYYFRRVVGAMRKRGVDKLDQDTHREFSDKVQPRPEAPPVKNISVLYEKAMFSGREVTMPDADNAKGYLTQVETSPSVDEKDRTRNKGSGTMTPRIG